MGHWAEIDENNIVIRVIVIKEAELDTGNWGEMMFSTPHHLQMIVTSLIPQHGVGYPLLQNPKIQRKVLMMRVYLMYGMKMYTKMILGIQKQRVG